MSFFLSPAVKTKEVDGTTNVPAVSTSAGAFVGNFRWGPIEEVTTVTSESDLVNQFSAPDLASTIDFHTAAYFLRFSNDLRLVRGATSAAKTANAGGDTSTLIKNDAAYENAVLEFDTVGNWIAKYAGEFGNSLKVEVFGYKTDDSTTLSNFNAWAYKSYFDGVVGTSEYANNYSSSNDEVHVVVIDEDGLFTGVAGTVLETFAFLSQASDAKTYDGSSAYFKNHINTNSKYIRFGDVDETNTPNAGTDASTGSVDYAVAPASGVISTSLTGGADSGALGASEFAFGWDLFENKDAVDVSLLIAPDLPANDRLTIANDIISIAKAREDCVAFVSPDKASDTAAEIVAFGNGLTFTSYFFMDSGRVKVYDKYNDTTIEIPVCTQVAGLCAQTDRTHDAWWAPAGLRRGQILGKLVYNPDETDRNDLFKAGINPIVTFAGEGTMLFGDKTHTNRSSAFDAINVRRLFIVLKKAIGKASREFLFEFNDEFTRADFTSTTDSYLRTVQGRRGVTDFLVVCDESNNTGDVIDRAEFAGDIYVKPNRATRGITLNFVATRAGVEFSEIVGDR